MYIFPTDKEKNMFTSLKSYFLANKENHHIITPLKGSCVLRMYRAYILVRIVQ